MTGYGGLKEYVFAIAAIIYVGGMFPLYYLYEVFPADRYTLIPTFSWISVAGCILLFGQWFVAALTAPTKPVSKPSSGS